MCDVCVILQDSLDSAPDQQISKQRFIYCWHYIMFVTLLLSEVDFISVSQREREKGREREKERGVERCRETEND